MKQEIKEILNKSAEEIADRIVIDSDEVFDVLTMYFDEKLTHKQFKIFESVSVKVCEELTDRIVKRNPIKIAEVEK